MAKRTLSVFLLCNEDGVVAINNLLPGKTPDRIAQFVDQFAKDDVLILGHNTFFSILSNEFKDHPRVVITTLPINQEGVIKALSLPDAIEKAREAYPQKNMCVLGGKRLIEVAIPLADFIYRGIAFTSIRKKEDDNIKRIDRAFERRFSTFGHIPVAENGARYLIEFLKRSISYRYKIKVVYTFIIKKLTVRFYALSILGRRAIKLRVKHFSKELIV